MMFAEALVEVEADCAVFDWLGCCAVVLVLEFGACCAWLLAGGGLLVWARDGDDDPPGCVEPAGAVVCACEGVLLEGAVCACDGLVEEAGADWLVVVFDGLVCAEVPAGAVL